MPKGDGIHRDIGRQAPTPGAHIFSWGNPTFSSSQRTPKMPYLGWPIPLYNTRWQTSGAQKRLLGWLGTTSSCEITCTFFVRHATCISRSTNGWNFGKAGSAAVMWTSRGHGSGNRSIIAFVVALNTSRSLVMCARIHCASNLSRAPKSGPIKDVFTTCNGRDDFHVVRNLACVRIRFRSKNRDGVEIGRRGSRPYRYVGQAKPLTHPQSPSPKNRLLSAGLLV